jgi:glyceraldehyde 3-phosphate dehydrogenase
MSIKIGINGLGRIGRGVLRALVESGRDDIELVGVNDLAPLETLLYLLKYDSVHGAFQGEVKAEGGDLLVNGNRIKLTQERNPADINWQADFVLECTGLFTAVEKASGHIHNNVKGVIVSAPSPDAHSTIVYGVNNDALKGDHTVISAGSCTTNCLAPVAKVLHDTFGIENGLMTTVHAYTNDQNVVDAAHKDLRRARAAALSMIPTSTGAAKAISLVIPELKGKLDGVAIRVPTPNVSMVDLTFSSSKDLSVDAINNALKSAAGSSSVLGYTDEALVSIDFNHNPNSSTFDASGTLVSGEKLGRIVSWYDNEWGFSNRMLDVTALFASVKG